VNDNDLTDLSYITFLTSFHRAFHGFGQAKLHNGGSVLGSSQFLILPQLSQKMMLGLKGVKFNLKISNLSH